MFPKLLLPAATEVIVVKWIKITKNRRPIEEKFIIYFLEDRRSSEEPGFYSPHGLPDCTSVPQIQSDSPGFPLQNIPPGQVKVAAFCH